MALTFAQLTAPAAIDDAADYNAALEAARLAKKQALYASLNSVGVQGVYSWATGSVPSSLVEIYAWSLFDYDLSQAYLALGALNSTAFSESGRGDAGQDGLSVLSREVYDNTRGAGLFTVCRIKLTDSAGNGPWTFQPNTVSFSVGRGGKRFDGFDFAGTGAAIVLPKSGTVYVYCKAEAAGSAYGSLSVGAVNTFARGSLSGVTVTNDSTWLNFVGAVVGTDDESDESLRDRNLHKWGELGTGSPASAYVSRCKAADPTNITRVETFTNFDIFDPGRIDIVIAGPAGAVAPSVVQAAQDAIAPLQIGGSFIPETARAVVTSAANRTINVTATVYVQAEYDTAAFQAQVSADFAAFAADHEIGGGKLGIVSAERIAEVLQYRAGLSAGIIYDVDAITPNTDTILAYNEVPLFDLTGLTYVRT